MIDKSLITKKTAAAIHVGLRRASSDMEEAVRDYNKTVVSFHKARDQYESTVIQLFAKLVSKRCSRKMEIDLDIKKVAYNRNMRTSCERVVNAIFMLGSELDSKARVTGKFIITAFCLKTAHIQKFECYDLDKAVDTFAKFLKNVDKESNKKKGRTCPSKTKRR